MSIMKISGGKKVRDYLGSLLSMQLQRVRVGQIEKKVKTRMDTRDILPASCDYSTLASTPHTAIAASSRGVPLLPYTRMDC